MTNKFRFKKPFKLKILVGIILFILAICIISCTISEDKLPDNFEIDSDEIDWDGNLVKSGEIEGASVESIQIPGYADLVFNEKVTNIQLINPTNNTVYMIYQILEGDTLLFETKGISPNKAVACDLGSLISEGTHTLTFKIATYDINTHEPCNGVTQTVKVTKK